MSEPAFVLAVDTSGLVCPLPILRAKKALQTLQSGEVLKILSTDKNALKDFQAFAKQTANELIYQEDLGQSAVHYLKKR